MANVLQRLLTLMFEKGGSDLHITVGSPPQLRLDGQLVPVKAPPLSAAETKQLCYSVCTEAQRKEFEEKQELDFSFGIKDLSRFRANMFIQRGTVAGAFRTIPFQIRSFEDLGLPKQVAKFGDRNQGLVLVTGPTGSGKSTTLAAILDYINVNQHKHILTIEDPIEYLHAHKKCVINQREVGADTEGFATALRRVLRQDPDVVLIGELRDKTTMESALTISETGHLCLATLHTNSAAHTITRILDVFPAHQQNQVRIQMSFVLEAVLSQHLIPRLDGTGRVLCTELLIATPAVRNLIRDDKVHQIYSQMQVGQKKWGMHTMNQSLYTLVTRRIVSSDHALARSPDPEELRNLLSQGSITGVAPKQQKQRRPSR